MCTGISACLGRRDHVTAATGFALCVCVSAALWIALEKLGVPESVVDLVKFFHEDMKARVRVDGELLEVTNGLRQGCRMAPTLFNLYAGVVVERWLDRIEPLDSVGTLVVSKQDGLLFWRSTRNTQEMMVSLLTM